MFLPGSMSAWYAGPQQPMAQLQNQNRIQPDYGNQVYPAVQPQQGGGMVGIEPWQRQPQMGGGQGQQPRPFMNFLSQLQNWFQQIPQQNQMVRDEIMQNNSQVRQGILDNNQAFRESLGQPIYRAMPVQGSYGTQHPANKPMWNAMNMGGY